tara:strand:- start:122 stop:349 length:228 start_codon:yes stop_codon:yes gene_type:complete
MNSRRVAPGDLIITKPRGEDKRYAGIVTNIEMISGSGCVFIEWSNDRPHSYNTTYGYCATNIHNCYDEFTIVKAK